MTHWAYCCCDRDPPAEDLYLFDPCEPNCDSFQMAATIATWTGLGLSLGPTYLFTPQTIECCKEDDADPPSCVRFCGTLRLATEGEITKFCTEGVSCSSCPPTGVIQVIDASYSGGSFLQISPLYDCNTAPCTGCRPVQCDADQILKLSITKRYRFRYRCDVPEGETATFTNYLGCFSDFTDTYTNMVGDFHVDFSIDFDAYLTVNTRKREYNDATDPKAWLESIISQHKTLETDCIDIKSVTYTENSFSHTGNIDRVRDSTGETAYSVATNIQGNIEALNISIPCIKIQKVDDLYESHFDCEDDPTDPPDQVCNGEDDGNCIWTYWSPLEFDLEINNRTSNVTIRFFDINCGGTFDDIVIDENFDSLPFDQPIKAHMGKIARNAEDYCCCGDDPSTALRLKTMGAGEDFPPHNTGNDMQQIYFLVRKALDWNIQTSEGAFGNEYSSLILEDYHTIRQGDDDFELFQGEPTYNYGDEGVAYLDVDDQEKFFDCLPEEINSNFSLNISESGTGRNTHEEVQTNKLIMMDVTDTITSWECLSKTDASIPASCDPTVTP